VPYRERCERAADPDAVEAALRVLRAAQRYDLQTLAVAFKRPLKPRVDWGRYEPADALANGKPRFASTAAETASLGGATGVGGVAFASATGGARAASPPPLKPTTSHGRGCEFDAWSSGHGLPPPRPRGGAAESRVSRTSRLSRTSRVSGELGGPTREMAIPAMSNVMTLP